MNKPKAKFIISRYKESFDWINNYTNNYLIYNKGEPILNNSHVINTENIGGNQRDIFKFIYENHNNLPKLMAFIQADPFPHCKKEIFDKLIYNDVFTPLEYYGMLPSNTFESRNKEGGFLEINNSWYIPSHNSTHKLKCKYSSFNEFMNKYFKNYVRLEWIRFAPGSQYIIRDTQALYYPRKFWQSLMNELPENNMTEAHIIERALYYILGNYYEQK